ncbi:ribose-phosphate pyrophosphokinase 4 [Quillaja saponaria]|uniref:Ribose-phosphate pyrophosphokinase 4 n=1 Tax=Quillaja saponaria TaxID=32244 RepID=A0AAD7KRL6_QUISA|nr:ribose-phosphate pyrophosphokinase 4 [Quillaja saponaria]
MAATRPFPSFSKSNTSDFPDACRFIKHSYSLLLPKPSEVKALRNKIRCKTKCFETHHNWTIEHVSEMQDSNQKSSSSLISLATSGAALESPAKNAKKVNLFYCAETKPLAEKIASQSDMIELRNISWGKFPDGFPNIFIPNAQGDVATAFTLARLLSNIPISRGGPTSLVTFDIHALQERFYFGDNILPCFESGIPLLLSRLQQLPDSDNISIAFPDDGAWKRFHKQLQHFPTIVCAKVREGDHRIVRIKEGDPSDRHIVIVDDLVQSGGTLIECQRVLAAHGAAKISAYVTHGIFPARSWERFEHDNGGNPEKGFTYFWITDSCPLTVTEVTNKRPFEVLSLAGSIAASLQI